MLIEKRNLRCKIMADIAILFKIDEKAQRFLEESQISFSVFQGDSSLEEWMVEQLKEAKVAILFPGQKFGERDLKMPLS
jgi:hypothetical protein